MSPYVEKISSSSPLFTTNVITDALKRTPVSVLIRKVSKKLFSVMSKVTWHYGAFDLNYFTQNPWCFDSGDEQFRFIRTNQILSEHLRNIRNILEIGSGEGHQTAYLSKLSPKITGIDISWIATKRARTALPRCQFLREDFLKISKKFKSQSYQLVTAFEVLYYVNPTKLFEEMDRIGENCVVTYFDSIREDTLSSILKKYNPTVRKIQFESSQWSIYFWKSTQKTQGRRGIGSD